MLVDNEVQTEVEPVVTLTLVDNKVQTEVEPVDDHYMQIPRFDCKSIMKSHSSKFRPLCPAVSKILQLTDSDNDSKNLVTVSRIVEICNGIVTYSPDLKLISCATTGGDFDFIVLLMSQT
ncbi:uncharacterized protein LOC118761373 isoform X1 [Octopus sinensis]|uniref:Uncharacterized protein LOC118761373 isoform X1 n=1 Tax=Octopus sinensis TaxID=2607531 RepID=A0A7E6EJG9_9MOLL|nr:uncharacterized protein LOC118761373 isoform X1 [Octopus sinensis]